MKQALSLMFRLFAIVVCYYSILMLPNPWLGFGVLTAVLIGSVPIFAWIRRSRFMRRLKKLCRERNADLEIRRGWCPRLVIRAETGSFACVVIPSLLKSVPLLLDNDGRGYRHIWGIRIPSRGGMRAMTRSGVLRGGVHLSERRDTVTKAYAFYIAPRHRLKFPEGYAKKFVITNPKPHHVLAGIVQNHIHVDNGERIAGEYSVYTGGAFCDFLDRQTTNYIDKYGREGL